MKDEFKGLRGEAKKCLANYRRNLKCMLFNEGNLFVQLLKAAEAMPEGELKELCEELKLSITQRTMLSTLKVSIDQDEELRKSLQNDEMVKHAAAYIVRKLHGIEND